MKSTYGSAETGTTVSLIMGEKDNAIVSGVEVHKDFRGRGYARKWLGAACHDADQEGITLMLSVDGFDPAIDLKRLRNFYKSVGFRAMFPEYPEETTMIREPRSAR